MSDRERLEAELRALLSSYLAARPLWVRAAVAATAWENATFERVLREFPARKHKRTSLEGFALTVAKEELVDACPDRDLTAAAQAGERLALEYFGMRVEKEARAYLRGRISKDLRRRVDVDDVVQNTVLQAFRGLPAFRGACPLRYWIWTIADRELKGAWKHETRQGEDVRRTESLARFETTEDTHA
jgi:DNA-directed RNA polymerase specialized sigma24 family protein